MFSTFILAAVLVVKTCFADITVDLNGLALNGQGSEQTFVLGSQDNCIIGGITLEINSMGYVGSKYLRDDYIVIVDDSGNNKAYFGTIDGAYAADVAQYNHPFDDVSDNKPISGVFTTMIDPCWTAPLSMNPPHSVKFASMYGDESNQSLYGSGSSLTLICVEPSNYVCVTALPSEPTTEAPTASPQQMLRSTVSSVIKRGYTMTNIRFQTKNMCSQNGVDPETGEALFLCRNVKLN